MAQGGDGYHSDDPGQSRIQREAVAYSRPSAHRSDMPGRSAAGSARDVVDRLCAAGHLMHLPKTLLEDPQLQCLYPAMFLPSC